MKKLILTFAILISSLQSNASEIKIDTKIIEVGQTLHLLTEDEIVPGSVGDWKVIVDPNFRPWIYELYAQSIFHTSGERFCLKIAEKFQTIKRQETNDFNLSVVAVQPILRQKSVPTRWNLIQDITYDMACKIQIGLSNYKI